MKIYHKKNFLWGTLLLLLGILLLATEVWKGLTLRSAVLAVLLLFFGSGLLLHSLSKTLSREDWVNEKDERSFLVTLKSRGTAFRFSQAACFLCLAATLLSHEILGPEATASLCLAFGLIWTVMMLSELAAFFYHEHHS